MHLRDQCLKDDNTNLSVNGVVKSITNSVTLIHCNISGAQSDQYMQLLKTFPELLRNNYNDLKIRPPSVPNHEVFSGN